MMFYRSLAFLLNFNETEKVSIAMHCNLRLPDVALSFSVIITRLVPSLKSVNLSVLADL